MSSSITISSNATAIDDMTNAIRANTSARKDMSTVIGLGVVDSYSKSQFDQLDSKVIDNVIDTVITQPDVMLNTNTAKMSENKKVVGGISAGVVVPISTDDSSKNTPSKSLPITIPPRKIYTSDE